MKTNLFKVLLLWLILVTISLFANSQTEKRIFIGGGATLLQNHTTQSYYSERHTPAMMATLKVFKFMLRCEILIV